jgi:cysteinyl-tRNA synthetase
VIFEVLWRWRERSGYDVVLARNITDVDDKITVPYLKPAPQLIECDR